MAAPIKIPRRLPLLLVSDNVLLPGSSMRIPVRSMRNMNMVKSRLMGRNTLSSTIIGVVPKEPEESIEDLLQESPFPVAKVHQLDKLPGEEITEGEMDNNSDLSLMAQNFREQASKLVDMLDISIPVVAKLKRMLDQLPSQHLPDICASIVKASYSEKIQVLDAVDLDERFRKTLPLLMRQIEGLKLLQNAKKNSVNPLVPKRALKGANTISLRKSSRADADEYDDDDDRDDLAELEQKIKSIGMTPEAQKAALKELKRLKKMPQQMPEHAMIRNYLDLMTELPWSHGSTDVIDINKARSDLDADHYGLDKLKKRVIEYLAVRQLKNNLKGPILCFVGPPGVGKTSIGRSIAMTLGREFHRISLGGVCDQSDIRGHRRTYIGSMPGRIIQGLKLVGTNNPVFLLDEIDKLGKSLHGDPAAALLEVLDPEQNNTFVDHYLNTAFDLSQVLFIATANSMATIPTPLLDRMEIIHVPGYTQEERVNIGVRHLIPKQLKEHGLTMDHVQIPEDTVRLIVSKYTREAGVRTLERRLGAICRAVAVKVAENNTAKKNKEKAIEALKIQEAVQSKVDKGAPVSLSGSKGAARAVKEEQQDVDSFHVEEATSMAHPPEMPIVIDEQALEDILGPPMFESETSERLSQPGVAVGLAWTAMGGEIMFVEASKMQGKGKVTLTGQLGDVMKESANLALNWLRAHRQQLQIEDDLLDKTDIHIHFPAGAVGKDGPSAGVTIVTVLVSLFTDRCVRSDTAMTGEVTLRGLVLPVGGIKEKMLAAHRAGITRVILPKRNEKDLHEVPNNVKDELSFTFAHRLEDVLNAAFEGGFPNLLTTVPAVDSKL